MVADKLPRSKAGLPTTGSAARTGLKRSFALPISRAAGTAAGAFGGAGKGAGVGAALVAAFAGAAPLVVTLPHPVSHPVSQPVSQQDASQHGLQQSASRMSLSTLRTGVHRGLQVGAQPVSQPVAQPVAQPAFSQQAVFSQRVTLGVQHSLAHIGQQGLGQQAGSHVLQAGSHVLQVDAHGPHAPQSNPSTRLRISPLNPELHSDTLNTSDPRIVVTLISANSFSEKRGVLLIPDNGFFACWCVEMRSQIHTRGPVVPKLSLVAVNRSATA